MRIVDDQNRRRHHNKKERKEFSRSLIIPNESNCIPISLSLSLSLSLLSVLVTLIFALIFTSSFDQERPRERGENRLFVFTLCALFKLCIQSVCITTIKVDFLVTHGER